MLIAALATDHPHHGPSFALLDGLPFRLAIAGHSLAEAYATLTRTNGPFRWTASETLDGIEALRDGLSLVGLSPEQTLGAIRGFAQAGEIGAKLYDRLIGEVAVVHRIPRLATWNIRHMRPLFPTLTVVRPDQLLA